MKSDRVQPGPALPERNTDGHHRTNINNAEARSRFERLIESGSLSSEDSPTAEVEILSTSDSWSELESADLGRIAIADGTDIDLYPVNYLVHEHHLYFRTAPGKKLVELTRDPRITFQADGARGGHVWSVIVKGQAERVSLDSEIHDSGIARLRSLSPTTKWNYVRISPSTITGRRFTPTR